MVGACSDGGVMTVRIGLVGARPELALMVAGIAAGCGAQVEQAEVLEPADPGHGWDLVLLDGWGIAELAAASGPGSPMARAVTGDRAPVVVVHLAGESETARPWAAAGGAEHVVELPAGRQWLADLLAGHPGNSTVLAVLGAVGGAGTTTVALACAWAVAGAGTSPTSACLLMDTDPASTGLDLPLGIPEGSGARWADLPAGGGALVADTLLAALPRIGGMAVLTGPVDDPVSPQVAAVMRTGRSDFAHTVVDAGRGPAPGALGRQDAAVIVVPATLAGVVGAHRVMQSIGTRRLLLAVRPSGWLPPAEVADQLGVERFVLLPTVRGLAEHADCGDVLAGRAGRALVRVGRLIWDCLP